MDVIELRRKMKRAIRELEHMAEEIREEGVDAERHIHLKSKAEGVKLALGYLEQEIKIYSNRMERLKKKFG